MESSQEYFDFFGTQKIESLHKKQRKPNWYFGSVISSLPFSIFTFTLSRKKRETKRGLRHANPKQGRSGAAAPTPNNAKGREFFNLLHPLFSLLPLVFSFCLISPSHPKKPKSPHIRTRISQTKTEKGKK